MMYLITTQGEDRLYQFIVCLRHMELFISDSDTQKIERLEARCECEICAVEQAAVESERRAERRNEAILGGYDV